MKTNKFVLLAFLVLQTITGMAETYTYEVGQFQKLKINANINVIYKNLPDSIGTARYEAPSGNDNLFLLTTKNNGTLRIQLTQTQWQNSEKLPVLYVYSDFLSSVESSSDLTVYIENPAPCSSFSVNEIGNGTINIENVKATNVSAAITTGNGTISISGKCENASFRMVGAGMIQADRLVAENVKCSILGTGSIGCWAVDNLNVKGIGSTKIYYKGHPNIKKTGGGKLFELPGNDAISSSKQGSEVKSFDAPLVKEETENNIEDNEDEYEIPDDEEYETIVTDDD